jgi:dihydrodipicolinate synthase/N-acetylneuraminate lyase
VPVRDYRARTKVALKELGVIDNTSMRPPLTEVSAESADAVRRALASAGFLAPAGTRS